MAVIQASVSGAVTATSTNNRTGRFKGYTSGTLASGLMKSLSAGRDSNILGNVLRDNSWMDKALTAGTFAYFSKAKYIIRRVTNSIAGVANTLLISGAANKTKRSINYIEDIRTSRVTTAIRAGYWNEYSGSFSTPVTVALDDVATDHAATPTRNVPGELTYKYAKPLPVNADYSVKKNG